MHPSLSRIVLYSSLITVVMGVLSLLYVPPIAARSQPVASGNLIYPLSYIVTIPGSHTTGDVVTFTHPIGSDPVSLHPVRVYDEDGTALRGMGRYAVPFGTGALPERLFGDGSDGDYSVPPNETAFADNVRTAISANANAGQSEIQVVSTNGLTGTDEILIIQMQGIGQNIQVGEYEFQHINNINENTLHLESPLLHNYGVGGGLYAQVVRVANYRTLTVPFNSVLSAHTWADNQQTAGIVAVRVKEVAQVQGIISANYLGYTGGPGGNFDEPISSQGWQGEAYNGLGVQSTGPNASAGGGGQGDNGDRNVGAGGGGGGYGSTGAPGENAGDPSSQGGEGGASHAAPALDEYIYLGSGGGGGGGDDDEVHKGGRGGYGGGIVFLAASQVVVNGSIQANGDTGFSGPGSGTTGRNGGGGGGSGGSIYILGGVVNLGQTTTALGGVGGLGRNNGGDGGTGGNGRIFVQHCSYYTGLTNPTAVTEPIECHIIEQIETPPYTTTRFIIPDSFSDGRTYQIQYGRRLVYTGPGEQVTSLRVPAGGWEYAVLDVLMSNFTPGNVTLRMDIGDDGTWDWTQTTMLGNPATIPVTGLEEAFTDYWESQGSPSDGTLDVPVRFSTSNGSDILLTNLTMEAAAPPTVTPTNTATTITANTPSPTASRTPTVTTTLPPNTTPIVTPSASATLASTPSHSPTTTSTPNTGTPTVTPTRTTIPATATLTPRPTLTVSVTPTPIIPTASPAVYMPLIVRASVQILPTPTPLPTCSQVEVEPNDTITQAANNPLYCEGVPLQGTGVYFIDPTDPRHYDVYRIYVPEAATLGVTLDSVIGEGPDFDLLLFDIHGGLVTSDQRQGDNCLTASVTPGFYFITAYADPLVGGVPYTLQWQRGQTCN